MKPSTFISVLLLLSLLLPQSQGIRLGKDLHLLNMKLSRTFDELQMEVVAKYSDSDSSTDGNGELTLCESMQCKGNNRKLLTATTDTAVASSTDPKNEKKDKEARYEAAPKPNGKGKEEFSVSSSTTEFEHYPDIIDIAGMDYSPAKRKTPIHN